MCTASTALGRAKLRAMERLPSVVEFEGVAGGKRLGEVGVPDLGAEGIALQGFYLDNVGAHVGHHGGTGGDGEPVGDLEDSDTFEGRFHVMASGR